MNLTYYPSHKHILNQYERFCGQHTGIMESQIVMQANSSLIRNVTLATAVMPNYHKALFGDSAEISYHLSGYGIYKEEAYVRLLGEGIERYGLFTSVLYYKDKLEYHTYNELAEKYPDKVIPWTLIDIYGDKEYEKLERSTFLSRVTKDDIIGWVECPSLFDKNRSYYIPAQMMFIGYRINKEKNEKWFTPAFSKGSAAHTSLEKALAGAITESIESDALMLKWYGQYHAKEVIIDDYDLSMIVNKILDGTNYSMRVYDYTIDPELGYVFGVALINNYNERPKVVMGCSSNYDPRKAIYRGLMEAMAILYLVINGPIVMPKDYLECAHEKEYANLDSNVSFWASITNSEEKLAHLENIVDGRKALSSYPDLLAEEGVNELDKLLTELKKISKYSVFMDITPVEVDKKGLKVMRVFSPDLVQMSFPGMPYSKHPRMIKYGGVQQNEFPHPLP